MIKCDNQYCIYQDEGLCLFQSIAVNEYGMCAHCRLLDIDAEELKTRKEIQLRALYCRESTPGLS